MNSASSRPRRGWAGERSGYAGERERSGHVGEMQGRGTGVGKFERRPGSARAEPPVSEKVAVLGRAARAGEGRRQGHRAGEERPRTGEGHPEGCRRTEEEWQEAEGGRAVPCRAESQGGQCSGEKKSRGVE
jgi:hypothetical protein